MAKLVFPSNDPRSNGESFNPKRPWLKQGAEGKIITKPILLTCQDSIYNGRHFIPRSVVAVKFKGSKDYDLVFRKHLLNE